MIKFQTIPTEGSETHVYIVPEGLSPYEKHPSPRPKDIILIEVENCPIKKTCVAMNRNNVTELCIHMGVYPENVDGQLVFESLPCSHPETPAERLAITSVTPFGRCTFQLERGACANREGGCEHLQGIAQAPGTDYSRPRFEITCGKGKKKKASTA